MLHGDLLLSLLGALLVAVGTCEASPAGDERGRPHFPKNTQIPVFELPGRPLNKVEVRDVAPKADEFLREYTRGWGKPVLFRGMARQQAVFESWKSDEYVKQKHGRSRLDNIETGKKETRSGAENSMRMAEFLSRYEAEDIYAVSELPRSMASEIVAPHSVQCSYAKDELTQKILWFSSGGTKSVIHQDDTDNLNCLYSGRKRLAMWHPIRKPWVENLRLSGWTDTDRLSKDSEYSQKYGAFAGPPLVDVDGIRVDIFKVWAEMERWDVQMEEGDCLFIPIGWYHHVYSAEGGRNMAVNLWWQRRPVDWDSGDSLDTCSKGTPPVTLGELQWSDSGSGSKKVAPILRWLVLDPSSIRRGSELWTDDGKMPEFDTLIKEFPHVEDYLEAHLAKVKQARAKQKRMNDEL